MQTRVRHADSTQTWMEDSAREYRPSIRIDIEDLQDVQ